MTLFQNFASPWYLLLLLLAIPLVIYLSRRSLAALGPFRRRVAIALRVLVVVLLVLALAEARILWKNDRLAVIFVVDRSASVPPGHQNAAREFVRLASDYRDRERADFVGCVVFGRNAGIEASPRAQNLFEKEEDFSIVIERSFTDIQSAIRLAVAAFPEGYGKRLVLITDGNENRGEAMEEARAAVEEGIAIDVISVRYSYPAEVLVDKVLVDPEVHIGEPFEVKTVLESTRETRGTLRLLENGRPISTREVELRAEKNIFTVTRQLELAGQYTYEALFEPASREEDGVPQNNRAHGFTHIRGEPKVLLCTDERALDLTLVEALRSQRINADVMGPEFLPSEANAYLQYDAVIFSNIAAHDLTEGKMRLLESLVKGAGIGFVMIGGKNSRGDAGSFGTGGYRGTPIEDVLPVYLDVKQKKQLPNGALAIVMHSCEINNGNYWAKRTVQKAITALSPQDWAGVLYYGGMGGESWLFRMRPCTQKAFMLSRLQGFVPGDMPDFSRILAMAHNGLRNTPAAIKHIIVFSDGDPQMPTRSAVDAMRADKITISTICMGWHTTPQNMINLANWGGGNYYPLTGPESLPEIFIREAVQVRKALIQEKDFRPVVRRGGSFLAGIDLDSLPPLRGYIMTSEKEEADHFLSAPPEEGDVVLDPILSSWQYGLGKSVAFTSDAARAWSPDWQSWESYERFWAQTIRWVSRVQSDDRFRVTQQREDDLGVVLIDVIDPSGKFVNEIDFEANVITPESRTVDVEVRQIAPGRYRLETPLGERGIYLVTLKYLKEDKPAIYSTALVSAYSPEYRNLSTNDTLLRRVADSTGGEVLDELERETERFETIFRRDFPISRTPQDLWRDLLQFAALLFFLDVFLRRVVIDYAKVSRTARDTLVSLVARREAKRTAADERLGALLRKKAEVQETRTSYRKFYAAAESGEEAESTLDPSFVAGAQAEQPASHKPAGAVSGDKKGAEKAPPGPREDEDSYTGRLLAAKRRALRKPGEPGTSSPGDKES